VLLIKRQSARETCTHEGGEGGALDPPRSSPLVAHSREVCGAVPCFAPMVASIGVVQKSPLVSHPWWLPLGCIFLCSLCLEYRDRFCTENASRDVHLFIFFGWIRMTEISFCYWEKCIMCYKSEILSCDPSAKQKRQRRRRDQGKVHPTRALPPPLPYTHTHKCDLLHRTPFPPL
jgi:hypothetical protein